jgi:hypothetical protein
MKKTNNTEKMSKLVKKALNLGPLPDPFGWPPVCDGYYYQPERPVIETHHPSDEKIEA